MAAMGSGESKVYLVFMNYDPEFERLRANRSKRGAYEVDMYLSRKHDGVLARNLERGTYRKTVSLGIVDGFSVEITEQQARVLRSVKEVRVVEKNQEVA